MIDLSKIPTYQAGVYQAKANKTFARIKGSILKNHGLTLAQWSVLGFVSEGGKAGVRPSDLATRLDTTQAFITGTVNSLVDKGFVRRTSQTSDGRTKLVTIVQKHIKTVEEIEQDIRGQLRINLYDRITREDLITYVKVLIEFAE